MPVKILDIGRNFGMAGFHVFEPWNPVEVRVDSVVGAELAMPEVDLVIFGGGADIHPSLYGHDNIGSHVGKIASARDLFETEVFKLAIAHNKPMLGLCRGAQLVCALSGGSLIQDVGGHHGQHQLECDDKREMFMTSVHHQMMYPWDIQHKLIAWTKPRSKGYHYDKQKIKGVLKTDVDPEIVFFPKTKALGIQGHPEFYSDAMAAPVVYTRELVQRHLRVNVIENEKVTA